MVNSLCNSRHETSQGLVELDRGLSPRAVITGLCIGMLINISNTYYGLRVGAASQMSMVSTLLGFFVLNSWSRFTSTPFTPPENILLVSIATATGAMPVTAGFIGIIPALEYLLTPEEGGPLRIDIGSLVIFASGVCFFGLIFASWLRPYFIDREQFPWPGAKATATLIKTLHESKAAELPHALQPSQPTYSYREYDRSPERQPLLTQKVKLEARIQWLWKGASVSGFLTIFMFFMPIFHDLPVFGFQAARRWLWSVDLSPGFFGQGLILGPMVPLHMLAGAVIGWGILSPYAKHRGWAPGNIDDWENGPRGWIIWISLAALLADVVVKLTWITLRPIWVACVANEDGLRATLWRRVIPWSPGRQRYCDAAHGTAEHEAGSSKQPEQAISSRALGMGFLAAVIACVLAVQHTFGSIIPWYYTLLAISLSLPMAAVGIRSLAETDYNPESALISQLVFATVVSHSHPYGIIANLFSASIAQAGANQAGDLSYDLKIGSLVGARPEVQLHGQIIGSAFGAVISCAIYKLYASQYPIPGPLFRVPSSFLVLSTARLVMGRGLPPGAGPFVLGAAILSAVTTIIKMRYAGRWWEKLVPSGVACAIGIYNTPSFTITRALGGIVQWALQRNRGRRDRREDSSMIVASGLVLGESIASLMTLALTAAKAPQLGGK